MKARGRKRARHTVRTEYTVQVLWLCGYSMAQIAAVVALRTKQVQGIVAGGDYAGRSRMSTEERQAHLDALKEARFAAGDEPIDGGILDEIPFEARPLGLRQKKGAR